MMPFDNSLHWLDPRNWSWIFDVWLVLIAVFQSKPIWKWIQRNREKSWPLANGKIESVDVNKSKASFIPTTSRSNSPTYDAEVGYSYAVNGNTEAGTYKRVFGSEEDAWEFLRELKGRSVSVHYNPNKPSASALSEPSIETLLQTRARKPVPEMFSSASANTLSPLISRFLWVFVVISAVGLVVSLWVHIGAVNGRRVAPETFFWILHTGIFVVWIPAILVSKQRVGNLRRNDFWKIVLSGSPQWMRFMVYGFFGYAIINFALFMLNAPPNGGSGDPPAGVWRGFSGHWMLFYSAALAILYTAASASETVRRCVNGHQVPPNANFCIKCGQPLAPS